MRWYQRFFRRELTEKHLDAELRFHLERRIADLVAGGMAPEEARRRARIEFGGFDQVKEECRDVGGSHIIETFVQDLRYGLRQLRRNPGFTIVAILTLALAIGANTAIFSVVNAVLLRPLPYKDSARIVDIFRRDGTSDSLPMFNYLRQDNPCFDDLAAYGLQASSINLRGGDRPELVQALKVSVKYFRLFGASPILGRTFTADEDQPGGAMALVMSYGLWQRRFGGDPAILGKTLTLGGAAFPVVGVLSPRHKLYPPTDVWIPLQADPNSTDQAHFLMVTGRLRSGTTLAGANAEMAVVGKGYAQARPEQLGKDDKLKVIPTQEEMTGDARPALLMLLGAVGLVLLIACANVANLLLARATGRQKEITVRAAIGAGRGRILRQMLTESLLLAGAGGALGLALGSWGVGALLAVIPADLRMYDRVREMAGVPGLDPWVAGFAVLLSVFTGVLFGFVPALQLSRTDVAASLKESSGQAGTSLRQNRARNALVAAQVAIAMVLLCGAVLLIRSLAAMHRVPPGFDPKNLLTMRVSLAGPEYARASVQDRLARQITERVQRLPGVETAAMGSALPFEPIIDTIFDIPGRPPLEGHKFSGDVLWCFVSPRYFETLRIPLRSGRWFREQESARTAVISEAMARKFWPHQNPVGQTIRIGVGAGPGLEEGATEIIGVVGDVHWGLDIEAPEVMYQPYSQVPDKAVELVSQLVPTGVAVRTKPGVAPLSVSRAVMEALLARDTQLPATHVQTMQQVIQRSTGETSFLLVLLGAFATIAVLLAGVGIYGVMSYSVEQRTHEIGIRLALGAERGEVLRLVAGQGLMLTFMGAGIGILAALALTRLLSGMLYGVKPTDPLTFIAVSLILIAVALLASYIPARRAAKVDPMVALRYE
ncbi:MAG TPA: ABC transporter permease [Terriglobia bacterium]|nr:ABC transporter permease [Terriglobia bacterium]